MITIKKPGIQYPPFHFPAGDALQTFLGCLQAALLPAGFIVIIFCKKHPTSASYIHLQDCVLECNSGRVLFNFHSFFRHNHSPREYTFDKWRAQAEVRFSNNSFSQLAELIIWQIICTYRGFPPEKSFPNIYICCRRRSSLAFRRKQSDEEVEEMARVERLKRLGKGKDTVFKISYQDKVTFDRVGEGWLRM